MDLYSFADGDPLNNFDPDGRLFAGTLNGAGQWGSQMYAGLGNALDAALHAIVNPWNPLTATRHFSGGYEADFRYQRNFDQGTAAFQLGHQLGYAGAEIGFQMGMFAGPMALGRMASTAAMRSAGGIGAEAVTARYVTSAQGLAQRAASATRTPIVSLQGPTMTGSTSVKTVATEGWVTQLQQQQMVVPNRRAFLNQKYGRTGNLDADINARGINDAIRANAELATGRAVAASAPGASAGAIGTRAHQIFQRLNNRLANRVAGSYRIRTEEFRDSFGGITKPRSGGSIGADVYYTPWNSPMPQRTIFDLKTFGTTPTSISVTRQREFQIRFGATATELFMRR